MLSTLFRSNSSFPVSIALSRPPHRLNALSDVGVLSTFLERSCINVETFERCDAEKHVLLCFIHFADESSFSIHSSMPRIPFMPDAHRFPLHRLRWHFFFRFLFHLCLGITYSMCVQCRVIWNNCSISTTLETVDTILQPCSVSYKRRPAYYCCFSNCFIMLSNVPEPLPTSPLTHTESQ